MNETAFDEPLFASLKPGLTSFCYRMLGSMDDADDAIPPRRSASLLRWLDEGRRSGKRVLTKTMISAGQRTMNGWTSTVSRGEVMALAGSRMGLE